MRAAASGRTECVQLLLSAGADITVQNNVSIILLSLRRCTFNMCKYYDNFIFLVIELFLVRVLHFIIVTVFIIYCTFNCDEKLLFYFNC